MKRSLLAAGVALTLLLAWTSAAQAQVFVRAPFVRVQVGPGVWVRAPFVNLVLPSTPPAYIYQSGQTVPAPPATEVLPQPELAPAPKVAPGQPLPGQPLPGQPLPGQPLPGQPMSPLSLEQFAKSFQAKAGSYEVDLINPVTKQPTKVRFTLPEGAARNVHVRQNEIEFRYGLLRFVRIEFDKDGAQVVSR